MFLQYEVKEIFMEMVHNIILSSARVKKMCSRFKMRSHCLFVVVEKSETSYCYHLVTRLMQRTDTPQVFPTSLFSARNKLLTS